MKLANTELSNLYKCIITLSIIGALALFDYHSFMVKSRKVGLYDDLIGRLNSVRVSIDKLEYLVDMVIVARNLEGVTVDVIKNDVGRLDKTINGLTANPEYLDILSNNAVLLEGVTAIASDWQPIKGEIGGLTPAMGQEEMLLMHSAVDMNSIMLSEKVNSMIAVISDGRKAVFKEMELIAVKSVIGFFAIMAALFVAMQVRVFTPIREAAASARRISSGDIAARFRTEGVGFLSKLSAELNRVLDYVNGTFASMQGANEAMASSLRARVSQIEAIGSVAGFAGMTLSKNEMLQMSLRESVSAGGASAAAVYLKEDGVLRLESSAGLAEDFIRDWSEIDAELPSAGPGKSPVVFNRLEELPDHGYATALRADGFKSIATVPLSFNDALLGHLCVLFKDEAQEHRAEGEPFFAALASEVSVLLGHFDLYNEERLSKMFLERVLNQIPAAFAVYDLSGRCVVINGVLKKLLGADQRLVIPGEYNIFEDELMAGGGLADEIKKTRDGYSVELVVDFNPHEMKKPGFFKGPPKRLKIRTFPLYDDGGEISNMLLIYEELQEHGNAGAGVASKW